MIGTNEEVVTFPSLAAPPLLCVGYPRTSSVGFGAHPVVQARIAAAGTGRGAALLYPHLLHHFLGLPFPGQEDHFPAVDRKHIQAAPEPSCDPLGLEGLPEAPKKQVSSAPGDATCPWQLERGVPQAVDEQADRRVLHLQEDRVPLAVAHEARGGEVPGVAAPTAVPEVRHPVHHLQNTSQGARLAVVQVGGVCGDSPHSSCYLFPSLPA